MNKVHSNSIGRETTTVQQDGLTSSELVRPTDTGHFELTSSASEQSTIDNTMSTYEIAECICGLLYLGLTLAMSLRYLQMLSPSMANDLWWSGFNTSGVQTYLIDVYNAQLNLLGNQTQSIDVTDKQFGIGKDYSQFYTPIEITPAYPRLLFNVMAYDLAAFVVALRQVPGLEYISSQFCWVDFNRSWEVAHTVMRQKRCNARYIDNGAVYLEPIVRLTDWNTWLHGVYGGAFNSTIGDAISRTPEGQAWLRDTPYAFTSIEAEVMQWRKVGITRYSVQFNNYYTYGMTETFGVQNALGVAQHITIKRKASEVRNGGWTTMWMYFGLWSDFLYADWYGYSIVINDRANQRFTAPCSYVDYVQDPANYSCDPCDLQWNPDAANCSPNYEMFLGLPNTPTFDLVHNNIGPLNSIDLYFVAPPRSLVKVYTTFQAILTELHFSNKTFAATMAAIPTLASDPIPPTWLQPSLMYLGGDPTCLFRSPTPFVQSYYSFDVTCSSKDSQLMTLTPEMAMFALWSTNQTNISDICKICPQFQDHCTSVLHAAIESTHLLRQSYENSSLEIVQSAYKDVVALNVNTIQFSINVTDLTNVFLRQPVLGGQLSSPWDVFGWMYLFEWVQGFREVVSFEGDVNILPLLSNRYEPILNQAESLEVPSSACQYLWVVAVVVTTTLVLVGHLVLIYCLRLRGRIVGRHLFQFNRIVGSVWLNRPLLFVRSLTAVILLSTSPLIFETRHGHAKLNANPRTYFESMLVAGEATWISYITFDFLLVLTPKSSPFLAPFTSVASWIALIVMDVCFPYPITANLNRQCCVDFIGKKLSCTVGMIQVGSLNRAVLLVVSQIAVVFITIMVGYACTWTRTSRLEHSRGHLLLSGSVLGFLHMQPNDHWVLDRASCAMCGLITYHQSLFDVKLWLLVTDKAKAHTKWGMKRFDHAWLNVHDALRKVQTKGPPVVLMNRPMKMKNRLVALAGLVYVIATLFGSVTFLTLTSTNMANDFWWANYSAMREHIYVSRLLNSQSTLRPHAGSISLSDDKFLDDANYSTCSSGQIGTIVKQLYSSLVLSTDGTDLASVIHGLRSMDGCLAPWISSQYCWLDFDKRWEMANSPARQIRCANNYSTNAAVYLESVLRNVQWPQLRSCWGTSLDIALGAPLKNLPNGTTWWKSVQSAKIPDDDELQHWHSFGLTTYAIDWQNYKSIGIIESFNIRNAFGLSYRMALKHTNGSFNLVAQTSMKMYWSFASDLWAVTDPSTSVYGASLIRQDGSFAFRNRSMESLLIENGTLRDSDLTIGAAFSAFRKTIGPFGSVDLKRVPVPPSMLAFSVYFMDIAAQLRIESTDFATFWIGRPPLLETWYMPPPWLETNTPKAIGGNLLCKEVPTADESSGLYLLTGASSACGTSVGEHIKIPRLSNLFALIGANLVRSNLTTDFIDDVCATIQTVDDFSCKDEYILPSLGFLLNDSMVDPSLLTNLRSMAEVAQNDMHALVVEINQYGRTVNGTAVVMRHEIFNPTYPSFHYIAWVLAMEWATNNREVISFQGNIGSANVLTARSFDVASLINPLEIPVNVAYYIRYVCLYVTVFVISVATLATLYLLGNKGHVEGLNLFAINRVVGIVWIGRTFLFIRSMAAICLLSTQVLSLENVNDLWRLVDATHLAHESSIDRSLRIFKTILAAGEVSWLCYVLSDILTLLTAQYTTGYTMKCTTLVWIVSASISLAAPATHVATLQRECQYAQVDFQLICTSGTIAIGSFGRFLLLVGICVGSVALCYLYERLCHPSLPPCHQTSLFLSASAKYIFRRDEWIFDDVYYIDPASAAINGILSIQVGSTFCLFDLKTWRLFAINVSKENRERIKQEGKLHLLSSIPLPS